MVMLIMLKVKKKLYPLQKKVENNSLIIKKIKIKLKINYTMVYESHIFT